MPWLENFLIMFLLIIIWILSYNLKQVKNENKRLNEVYNLLNKKNCFKCRYLRFFWFNSLVLLIFLIIFVIIFI